MEAADSNDIAVGKDGSALDGFCIKQGAIAAVAVFQPPMPVLQDDTSMFATGEAVIYHNRVACRTSQSGNWQ